MFEHYKCSARIHVYLKTKFPPYPITQSFWLNSEDFIIHNQDASCVIIAHSVFLYAVYYWEHSNQRTFYVTDLFNVLEHTPVDINDCIPPHVFSSVKFGIGWIWVHSTHCDEIRKCTCRDKNYWKYVSISQIRTELYRIIVYEFEWLLECALQSSFN